MSNQSINEFKDAMSTIKARGIVKTNILKSDAIYRYDFNTGKFKPYDKKKLYRLFNRLYLNSYDVNYSIDAVINDLDAVNFNQVEHYYKYIDADKKRFNLADLENKKDMYLKLNNENKKTVHTIYWKPQSQLQQLINNDVFTDGKILCKYNGKYFDIIAPMDLMRFFRTANHLEHLSTRELANNYGFFINNLVNIGNLFEDMKEYNNTQRILNNYKNDYENIKRLIDGFN